jgi:putative nucleotidyltransferase with HDIG domain
MVSSDPTGQPHVAIVISDQSRRSLAASCLRSFYRCAEYTDTSQALAGCRASVPRLILVCEKLSTSGGFDFVRKLQLDPVLAAIPVLILVAKADKATLDGVFQCGARHYLVSPYSRSGLISAISGLLNARIEREWRTLHATPRRALTGMLDLFNGIADRIGNGEPIPYHAVREACEPLAEAVAKSDFKGILHAVRDHDNYTFAHSMRVATYLALFGSNLSLSRDEQLILASGGLLHDVGKMSIPYELLNKPGRLSAAEFTVMKGHVTASVNYLSVCSDLPKGIVTIAAQHHEMLDGSGYPLGLAGKQLNRLARMASIIDVFSALTDRRSYKPPMDPETALALMVNDMAASLDMTLLGLFRQMLLDAA